QWTTVGIPRVFSKVGPGDPVKAAPPTTVPFCANTVVLGNPRGNICTSASESEMVYSLRITCPAELRITVGCQTGKMGSWVTNMGMVVGSRGTSLGGGSPIPWADRATGSS